MKTVMKLVDGKFTAVSEKSWLDQIVKNPETGNRVKVRSLPPRIRERYKPKHEKKVEKISHKKTSKEEKSTQEAFNDLMVKKWKGKMPPGETVEPDDGKTPETNPNLFVKLGGKHYRLETAPPRGKAKDFEYGKPIMTKGLSEKNQMDKPIFIVPMIPTNKKAREGKPKAAYIYSLDFCRKSNRLTMLSQRHFMKHWGEYKEKNLSHLSEHPIGSKTYACAAAFGVQMETAGRIGDEKGTGRGTYGISTLLRKHVKLEGSIVRLSYTGKDGEKQQHIVTNPKLVSAIKSLYKKGSKPSDPLFSYDKSGKNKGISSEDMHRREIVKDEKGKPELDAEGHPKIRNRGYINSVLGAGITSHTVRHCWATKVFSTESSRVDRSKYKIKYDNSGNPEKEYVDKVMDTLYKCVDSAASKLGNERKACLGNYIDPSVIVGFLNGFGMKPEHYPKGLRSYMVKSSLLLFSHLNPITSENIPNNWMFDDAKMENMEEFYEFLISRKLHEDPPVPEGMEKGVEEGLIKGVTEDDL